MRLDRLTLVVAVPLLLVYASEAPAFVAGKGKGGCYAGWQVTSPDISTPKISCADGDPSCDADGVPDGQCTFSVSVCAFQTGVAGCNPATVDSITLKKKAPQFGIGLPTLPASAASCGPATNVVVPLKTTKKGTKKPSKPVKLGLVATASTGSPKKGKANLTLVCTLPSGGGHCPPNPAGATEPNEVIFTVIDKGTDLDNGWTGSSHNFPTPAGTKFQMCLQDCNATDKSMCTTTFTTGPGTFNKETFGPPLPLFTAMIPVCVVNKYAPMQSTGTADLKTGEVNGPIHLLSSVYLTDETHVCPRCENGTCDSGPNQGKTCAVDGIVTVSEAATPNKTFKLSKDCGPPTDSLAGTLTINLPLTTGTSMLNPLPGGSPTIPCVAQPGEPALVRPKANNCGAGTCSGACSGDRCANPNGTDYVTGATVCVDSKGGLSQFCCSTSSSTACHANDPATGLITRKGNPLPPQPPWPEGTYPKKTDCAPNQCLVQAATFCEPGTGTASVDTLAGIPGPGTLILPVTTLWLKPTP